MSFGISQFINGHVNDPCGGIVSVGGQLTLPCHVGRRPAEAVALEFADGVTVWLSVIDDLQAVIGKVLEKASYEERRLFEAMQHQLSHEEEVTRLLDSGILGPSSRALSFYTHAWKLYLSELEALNLGKKAENSEKS